MWASRTYTFSPSTTVRSAEVNQNFTDLVNCLDIAMPSAAGGHGIIMFSGAIASIPTGWYLCNGANGTPDLRDKFIVGAGSTYAVDGTGGEATHILTTPEIPAHTHGIQSDGGTDNSSGDYSRLDSGFSKTLQTVTAGGGGAHNNLPPYHALAFIQKS